jgi:superfamily II DNA/RNA helicase
MSVQSSSGDSPDRDPHDLSPSTPNPEAPQAPPASTADASSSDPTPGEDRVAEISAAAATAEPVEVSATTSVAEPALVSATTSVAAPADSTSGDFHYPEPDAAPEGPPLPESFDELALPDALRRAIARLGWTKPSPVQALSFDPLIAGRDVMVQSHTGSGKTGAFCVPWLASRFNPGPASETGVQLLVLLPTRELAKQVCDELRRLAVETPVEVLPVYGGTPMNPQLTALRSGVHAVVGTPGRILDHIRRRSLDLSRVRTVVLDECDEMLSMGFLEDIRAILDQIKGEHLTALFSATIPSDIERIAKRYMNDPVTVQLSGDQVAAAEIEHAYYMVSSSIKTRDLLDVVMVEDPSRAIVFCNTREETKLVASVLRREGFHAEELSSDLNQTQRERVMKLMREHKIRFLVATDVAARGIDISHVTHVINYSFPESAEVYVHRTGRTGRAGRTGIALSLINPREIGNFYYLKLQYSSIHFGERTLPPAEQLAAQRTEFKLDAISKRFPELVSPEWVLLARSLMADPRGERVIALLLERAMRQAPRPEQLLEASEGDDAGTSQTASEPTGPTGPGETIERESRDLREGREPRERSDRDRDRGGPRDRPRFGDRPRDDRPRFGDRPRDDRPRDDRPRDDRPRDDRPRFGDRPRDDQPRDDQPRDDLPRESQVTTPGSTPEPVATSAATTGPEGEERPRRRERFRDDRGPRREGEPGQFRPRDDRPRDDRPRDDRPRDDRPRDDRPRDDRPRDDRPRDDRPRDDRPRDDRPREPGRFRNRDDRPRDAQAQGNEPNRFRNRDDRPRDAQAQGNEQANAEPDRFRGRDEQAGNGERRRRRERGAPEQAQLPLQDASTAAVVVEPSTPVLAPAPAVLTGAPGAEVIAIAVPAAMPAPGHIRLDHRGRKGDRGRGVVRSLVVASGELTAAPPVDAVLIAHTGESAPAGDTGPGGESSEGRRKRRRRRRRGRRDGEGAPGQEPGADATDTDTDIGADEDESETSAEPETSVAPSAAAGVAEAQTGDARRKRRRRRRGPGRPIDEAPRAPEPPPQPRSEPVVVPRRMTQEEIIIDIDESELEVVQNEFGELEDEFDEFALMDRRQAVIETLQEEVELEDVSRRDASQRDAVLLDESGENEADDDTDDADEPTQDPSDEPGDATGEAGEAGEADDADARRKKRRRRRKKAAAVVLPELTAPPHKDFWEVWAAKYTFQDFEDDKFSPPNNVPEIEDEPPPVVVERAAPRPSQPRPAPQQRSAPPTRPPLLAAVISPGAEADDAEFTKVCLNLGRSHGHKAATIRGLLRDQLGLEGRSIRDLTVRDGDTLFRVHAGEVGRIQEALTGVREGKLQLSVRLAEDDDRAELRAPPPAELAAPPAHPAIDAGGSNEPETISLDPLEFTDAPRLGDDAGSN